MLAGGVFARATSATDRRAQQIPSDANDELRLRHVRGAPSGLGLQPDAKGPIQSNHPLAERQ